MAQKPTDRMGEDALSTLLSALEELVNNASQINKKIIYAIYFLMGWCIFVFALWISSIIELHLIGILIYTTLFIMVLLALRGLLGIREALAVVINRYSAYKFMDNINFKIPSGSTPVERYLKYLNKTLNFEKNLIKKGGKIESPKKLPCGITVDYYAELKYNAFRQLMGHRNYSFFLMKKDSVDISFLKSFVKCIKNFADDRKTEIGRAVIITSGDIDDEVYDYLVNFRSEMPLQVVIEMDDNTYDFIPIIAPRSDLLP